MGTVTTVWRPSDIAPPPPSQSSSAAASAPTPLPLPPPPGELRRQKRCRGWRWRRRGIRRSGRGRRRWWWRRHWGGRAEAGAADDDDYEAAGGGWLALYDLYWTEFADLLYITFLQKWRERNSKSEPSDKGRMCLAPKQFTWIIQSLRCFCWNWTLGSTFSSQSSKFCFLWSVLSSMTGFLSDLSRPRC